MNEIRPDEIYNLAAQSHVQVSFDAPEYSGDVDALGWTYKTELEDGLRLSYEDFLNNPMRAER